MTGSGDEAIQNQIGTLDCFRRRPAGHGRQVASLAMTRELTKRLSPRNHARRKTHFINMINQIAIAPQS
jgi:hypothetical protein